MGLLRKLEGGAGWLLRTRDILGRSQACTIRLDGPQVSGEHAVLRWTGAHWHIQDLGSRNGVYVDGRRLGQDERAVVRAGAVIGLGTAAYTLSDDAPPIAFATRVGGGAEATILAVGEILTLPGPGDGAMIVRAAAGWSLEDADEVRRIADDEVVIVGDAAWRVCLPDAPAATADAHGDGPRLDALRLRFTVSRDEEYVELVAFHRERMFDFKARAHHYPLLVLARVRLRAPAAEGWIDQNELLRLLRFDRSQLHRDIHRLRVEFGEAGIEGAPRVVERRAGTRKLRIGVADLEIVPLANP